MGDGTRIQTDWRTALTVLAWLTTVAAVGVAQEPDRTDTEMPDAAERSVVRELDGADAGWSNATELSVVRTQGNAETQTFGFKNTLRRNWTRARTRLRIDGVRARTAGHRVLLVEPGLRFLPGDLPDQFETTAARAGGAPDVEQYFVEGRLELNISERFFWNAGTGWDRNHDAGIRNRYVAFSGVGNVWANAEDLSFSTSYGISYTVREEIEPDAAKDDRFGGFRLDSDYHQRLGAGLELDSDLALNVNLSTASDYSLNVTNAVGVAMSEHLSLRVSLQHLYEHQPALEDAVIRARAMLIDPDGTPGSGDELFETVMTGGTAFDVGTGADPQVGARRHIPNGAGDQLLNRGRCRPPAEITIRRPVHDDQKPAPDGGPTGRVEAELSAADFCQRTCKGSGRSMRLDDRRRAGGRVRFHLPRECLNRQGCRSDPQACEDSGGQRCFGR